ncbi:MAG: hypothetical protein GY853_01300 [PVC group bacterium]|nr:hypothetical protein [PVC group bacterium]
MGDEFVLKSVPYYAQIDNKLFARSACYPTSVAMAMQYCLNIEELTKEDIGCDRGVQLEDHLTAMTESKAVREWIKRNVSKYGAWMLKYKPRTIAYVEEHVFNILMESLGYQAKFKLLSWGGFCNLMEDEELAMPVRGYFPALLGGGHICCAVGFSRKKREIIVNDPFGNAKEKYTTHKLGAYLTYPVDKWFMDRSRKIWVTTINRKG